MSHAPRLSISPSVEPESAEDSDLSRKGYLALRFIGEGAMARVYQAFSSTRHRLVALKVLRKAFMNNREWVLRFEREARIAMRLRAPNIVEHYAFERTVEGRPYMVMERLQGQTLGQRLARSAAIPQDEALDYAWQICGALRIAHGISVIHRDLKPSNIFLAEGQGSASGTPSSTDAGGVTVKVMDFGIAIQTGELEITGAGSTVGTPRYMSPEQLLGSACVDARSDLWSLGVVLYRMLCGANPFDDTNLERLTTSILKKPSRHLGILAPWVDEDLAEVVMKLLRKAPGDRYADIDALLDALAPFMNGPPTLRCA